MRDLSAGDGRAWVAGLEALSGQLRLMLEHAGACKTLAQRFADARFTLFVGRGANVPVAAEGALPASDCQADGTGFWLERFADTAAGCGHAHCSCVGGSL